MARDDQRRAPDASYNCSCRRSNSKETFRKREKFPILGEIQGEKLRTGTTDKIDNYVSKISEIFLILDGGPESVS